MKKGFTSSTASRSATWPRCKTCSTSRRLPSWTVRPARSRKATQNELRGEELFFGKAQCATCHPPPYYLDHQMHDLQLERFRMNRPTDRSKPSRCAASKTARPTCTTAAVSRSKTPSSSSISSSVCSFPTKKSLTSRRSCGSCKRL